MIHLALTIASFLFLVCVAVGALGLIVKIFGNSGSRPLEVYTPRPTHEDRLLSEKKRKEDDEKEKEKEKERRWLEGVKELDDYVSLRSHWLLSMGWKGLIFTEHGNYGKAFGYRVDMDENAYDTAISQGDKKRPEYYYKTTVYELLEEIEAIKKEEAERIKCAKEWKRRVADEHYEKNVAPLKLYCSIRRSWFIGFGWKALVNTKYGDRKHLDKVQKKLEKKGKPEESRGKPGRVESRLAPS